MTVAWLAITAALGSMAWLAVWHERAVAAALLPVALAASWVALQQPLGEPSTRVPDGEYVVLGSRIDVNVAIYVLVDGDEPRYYRLPYSDAAAEQLQRAQEQPGGVLMDAQDGEFGFDGAPTAGAPKQAERPELRIGG